MNKDTARQRLGVNGDPLLLTVARLAPRKGVDRTIEALPQIRARFPGVQYVVAGDGPDRSRLEKLAEAQGCKDCVHFLGNFSDAEKGALYSAADVFVMPCRLIPSRSVEGFGIVFLEAGYYGVPVVAGCSGGVPDAVRANETGLLVAPEYPDDIARAVLELFQDPERARRMGQRGRERVQSELTWDHVVQRLERHLLAGLRSRADVL
ncbi:MAG: glycosyltransferase family 4 protein [Candidatus Hydrogenedentota bacterium]